MLNNKKKKVLLLISFSYKIYLGFHLRDNKQGSV